MEAGEVWWVQFDEPRLVVLLSDCDSSGVQCVQIVAPAGVDLGDLGIEIAVGAIGALPNGGVIRMAFPRPGYRPCTWLTTVRADDLMNRAGRVPPAKLDEIEGALRLCSQERQWSTESIDRFNRIRDAIRTQGRGRTGEDAVQRHSPDGDNTAVATAEAVGTSGN